MNPCHDIQLKVNMAQTGTAIKQSDTTITAGQVISSAGKIQKNALTAISKV
jgi:hypothetical protein